ncbi:MAG: protein transcription factor [Spirochaetaceae bacterium]|nr:MAG: protein transcription factor [Spirochaetaceae bacterium]
MPLNIKNSSTHRQARELAELTGQSITEAVSNAVSDALAREKQRRETARALTFRTLQEIALQCARLPVQNEDTEDKILGYDEKGIPS